MKGKIYNRDIILILAASFCYMACPMMVTSIITGFAGSLGTSGTIMGIIGGMMNMCSLLCRPIAGNLTDRVSKYRLSAMGALCMIIACIGYILANNTWVLIAARLIHGIGFSCCSVCMSTWMSDMLPKDRIGSGMGIYGTMNALSMAIAPSIGIKLSEHLGYRAAFWAAGGFAVLTIIMIQFIGNKGEPVKPEETEPVIAKENEKKPQLQVIEKRVVPIAIIVMLFALPYCATQSFLVSYVQAKEINVAVSLFFPAYALALLILRIALSKLFDKYSFGFFMTASALSAAAALLCLSGMKNNLVMFLAAVFMAGGYGIMCSVAQSNAILLVGKEKKGLANSTYYVGLDLGMALGPVLGGVFYEKMDIQWFYPIFLLTIPLCFLVLAGAKQLHRGKEPCGDMIQNL